MQEDRDFPSKYSDYVIDDNYDYNSEEGKLYTKIETEYVPLVYHEHTYGALKFMTEDNKPFFEKNGWEVSYLFDIHTHKIFMEDTQRGSLSSDDIHEKYSRYELLENFIEIYKPSNIL
jgi:hypothetical protein